MRQGREHEPILRAGSFFLLWCFFRPINSTRRALWVACGKLGVVESNPCVEEVEHLAKVCAICGKTIGFGHLVSHSNIKTNRIWAPNIQKVRILVEGRAVKTPVCTRCLRSGKVKRAV
jgi:large subunit ribosomal protein L28